MDFDSFNETQKAEIKQRIIAFYSAFAGQIERAANNNASDEDISAIAGYVNNKLSNGMSFSDVLNALQVAGTDIEECEKLAPGYGAYLYKIVKAWKNIGSRASNGTWNKIKNAATSALSGNYEEAANAAKDAAKEVVGAATSLFSGENSPTPASPTESNPPTRASTANQQPQTSGAQPSSDFFGSIGSFFSNGFDILGMYGSSIISAFKNGTSIEDSIKNAQEFRTVANTIKNDPWLSEDQKKVAYQQLVTEAHKKMGMDDEGAEKTTSFLFNTLKIPTNMVTGLFSNAGDFLKEVFTPTARYNIYEPLTDQAVDRYLQPIRDSATSIMDTRQTRYGINNLMRFGLTEAQASKIMDYIKNPIAKQMFAAATPQILNQMFGAEVGAQVMSKLKGNIDALLNGFQGDGNDIFNQLDQGSFSKRSLYALGEAANALTQDLSFKTGWARAEDFASTVSDMESMGWNPEDYVIRGDLENNQDMVRMYSRLDEENQKEMGERYIKTKRLKAMQNALASTNVKNTYKEAYNKDIEIVYNENGELDVDRTLGNDDFLVDTVKEAAASAETQAKNNITAIQEGKSVDDRDLASAISGQTMADLIRDRTTQLQSVKTVFSTMRGVREALGGKEMDDATARQLVRTLGNSNVNADYGDATQHANLVSMYMSNANVDFKKMLSAASLAGETVKQLGMNPEMTQQAALLGSVLLNNQVSARGSREFIDMDRATAVSFQNGARIVGGRAYKDLVWVATATFKNDPNGQKFKEIQEKIARGEELEDTDWDLIQSEQARAAAFNGDDNQYRLSRDNISEKATLLSTTQQLRIGAAATEKEQEIVRERMRQTTEKDWIDAVAPYLNQEGGYTAEEFRNEYTKLLGIANPEQAIKILMGEETLTPEQKEQYAAKYGDAAAEELQKKIDNKATQIIDKENFRLNAVAAATREAHNLDYGSLVDFGTALSSKNQKINDEVEVQAAIKSKAGADGGQSFIETVLGAPKNASKGTLAGRALRVLLGSTEMNIEKVEKQLGEENGYLGHQAFIAAGTNSTYGAKSANEFFEQVWGVNAENTEAFDKLRTDLASGVSSVEGELGMDSFDFTNADKDTLFKHIQAAFRVTGERGEKLRAAYARVLAKSDYGKALWEAFKAATKVDKDTALSKMDDIINGVNQEASAGGVEGGVVTPEDLTATDDTAPTDSGAATSEVGQRSVPASNRGTESEPMYVMIHPDQLKELKNNQGILGWFA